jgi:3-methyl-2-oxobutanoate hydroxymethyltransferase
MPSSRASGPRKPWPHRLPLAIVLVGDSLGMTVLGWDTTLPVTMDDMIPHARAVTRGCRSSFVLGDMPYMSYQSSIQDAVRNAGRFMAEAATDGVKLEGGRTMVDRVEAIVRAGIPVMGHLGLTPQSMSMLGGFKAQAKTGSAAVQLWEDAKALEEAGIFALLLECVSH